MNPLVSVLMPAYNAQEWIAGAIESALTQTWPRKEVIIVDDGSTDDTLQVARRYASSTVKVLSQENRGASAARNRALYYAQGDYIQWLDADNLLAPDKIARQLAGRDTAAASRILLSSAWGVFFYSPENSRFLQSPLWQDLSPCEWLYRKLRENTFMVPESWLVSRDLTEAAGPWDEALSLDDDGDYFSRVVRHCERIAFIPDARSYYRSGNPGSLSSVARRSQKKLRSQFTSLCRQIEILRGMEDSPRTRAACVKYLQDSFFYFFPDDMEIVHQVQEMARALGGELSLPQLGWKYRWIKTLFGWKVAKQVRFGAPAVKSVVRTKLERVLRKLPRREVVEAAGGDG